MANRLADESNGWPVLPLLRGAKSINVSAHFQWRSMKRSELLRLARVGAAARVLELQKEIDAIRRQFPSVRSGRSSGAGEEGNGRPARRRGRQMSARARKAVSLAQKKRWAEWRKNKGKQ